MLKVHIYQRSVPVASLGDFLGKAYVVVIPLESKECLDVHPMAHRDEFVLHASFTSTGTYKAWVQLLLEGRLYTFDFILLIKELPLYGHQH